MRVNEDPSEDAVTRPSSEAGSADTTLAWITTGLPPEVTGTALGNAERARWFAMQPGVRLVVMAPEIPKAGPSAAVVGRVEPPLLPGAAVLHYPAKPWFPYRLLYAPRRSAIAWVDAALEAAKLDAVIVTDVERSFCFGAWAMLGQRYARRHGIPYLAHYNTDFIGFAGSYPGWRHLRFPLMPLLLRWVYRQFDAVACATEDAASRLRAHGVSSVHHVPFIGIDLSEFHPRHRDRRRILRWVPAHDGRGKVVLSLGRLAREKRVDALIAAFHRLRLQQEHQELTLLIAGDGPPEVVAELRSAAWGSDRIHFLGFVHGQDRASLFASVDAFCTASPDETFGRTVVEAMASGIPVVAPSSGGFTDYLRPDDNALLFPPGDAEALVHALHRALTSDMASLGARAFDCAQGFSIERGCRCLLDWYRQFVQASSHRRSLVP